MNCRRNILPGMSALAALLAVLGCRDVIAKNNPPVPSAKFLRSENFFTNSPIPRLRIQIADSELAALRRENRSYVRATVREGDTVYTEVAIHLKGGAGSFRGIDDKPALTLNFDRFHKAQYFHGLDKIHLNNSVQDPTFMTENICGALFRAAGVPAPRTTNARVELNGRDLGFYVLLEGFDTLFLRHNFQNPYGTLYDGGFCVDITAPLQVLSNTGPKDRADLRALMLAAQEPDPGKRWRRLEPLLDLDRFISFVALEAMTSHWDGYTMNRNNYRIYHDPTTDRLIFLPHGMDQMFREGDALYPNGNGFLARAVFETPEGKRRYLDRLESLYATTFNVHALTNRVGELTARIRPVLAEYNPAAAQAHEHAANALRHLIVQRGRFIEQQLAAIPKPLKRDPSGSVQPTGWKPKIDSGNPVLEHVAEGGRQLLRIRAAHGNCLASWRTRVALDGGRYRFEGLVRTVNVVSGNEGNVGAGIRMSGTQRSNKLTGTSGWQKIEFDLEIGGPTGEVELVCELRATQGEASFDLASLRLVRRH